MYKCAFYKNLSEYQKHLGNMFSKKEQLIFYKTSIGTMQHAYNTFAMQRNVITFSQIQKKHKSEKLFLGVSGGIKGAKSPKNYP